VRNFNHSRIFPTTQIGGGAGPVLQITISYIGQVLGIDQYHHLSSLAPEFHLHPSTHLCLNLKITTAILSLGSISSLVTAKACGQGNRQTTNDQPTKDVVPHPSLSSSDQQCNVETAQTLSIDTLSPFLLHVPMSDLISSSCGVWISLYN
jgi:hypothetical protein